MTRAVQHVGVPGYQFQAGVMWDGALLFGAGDGLSAASLADIMVRAGAVRAMEMDINHVWVTFETFTPAPATPYGAHGTNILNGMWPHADMLEWFGVMFMVRRIEVDYERGARLDESTPGAGLGLSIVSELARAYGGALHLSRGDMGGLKASLVLPSAD